eukprot:g10730.t1
MEAFPGAATLIQEVPVVGAVFAAFLTLKELVEKAKSNKEDLASLLDLCNVVIKRVLRERAEGELEKDFRTLEKHLMEAKQVAQRCGDGPRNHLLHRLFLGSVISRRMAAVEKTLLDFSVTMRVDLSPDLDAERREMAARLATKQEGHKPSSAQVAGAPRIQQWYIERKKVLSMVCDRLGVESSAEDVKEPRMIGLAGPAGGGKTIAASMVVARGDVRASFHKGVLWLPVGKGATNRLAVLMFHLAEMVHETVTQKGGRPPRKSNVHINTEDGAAYIREVVGESSQRFLVVADDVWEVEVLQELKKAGASVLYTTREDKLLPDFPSLRLDQIQEEEAEMILRRAAELDDNARLTEAAYELMKRCEHFMSDLVVVGRWSDVRRRSDKQAWQKALRRIVEAQKGGDGGKLLPARAAVLRAGLKEVASDNAQNKELYLALAILPTGLAFSSKVAGTNCCTEEKKAAEQVLATLERWSIVTPRVDGEYRVHEDHVDFVWDCLLANRDTQDRVLPKWREYISSVEALDTYTTYSLLKIWRVLAKVEGGSVVPSRIDKVWDAIDSSDDGLPGALKKVAEFHYERQDWSGAYDKYSRLCKIEEAASGGEDSLFRVANTLHSLGMCAYEMVGREEETESLLRRALEIQTKKLGPDHPEVANTLHSLGVCVREAGNTDEAEDLLRQALAIRKEKGNDPLSLARIQYSLGVCVYKTGRPQEAEEELKEALAIRKEWLGHEHPEVANALYYLGLCDHKTGRTVEGERKLFRALKIFEKKMGYDHQDVADTLFSLGNCALVGGERTSEAEGYYRRALAIVEEKGSDPLNLACTLHSLGISMQGVITATVFGSGVTAMDTFGGCLETTVAAFLRWFCEAHWLVHVLVVALAGSCFYQSVLFSIGEFKAGNAEFSAGGRRLIRAKRAAIARGQARSRTVR